MIVDMRNRLLSLLEENARYSVEELALMLGSDAETIAAEMAQLHKDGIIRGYTALINWDKVDNTHVTAIIELKVTPQPDAGFEDIAERVMGFEHVESVYLMSGGYDLCVIVKGRSFQEIAMFVAKRLATIAGVVSTATHFILRTYKDNGIEIQDTKLDDRENVSF